MEQSTNTTQSKLCRSMAILLMSMYHVVYDRIRTLFDSITIFLPIAVYPLEDLKETEIFIIFDCVIRNKY